MEMNVLTYEQAARHLNMPLGTLRALVHRKQISHIRYGPRSVRFRREVLDAWLAARDVCAHDQEGPAR